MNIGTLAHEAAMPANRERECRECVHLSRYGLQKGRGVGFWETFEVFNLPDSLSQL